MIEQYIYNRITQDETLQELLTAGSDGFHIYPNKVPRGTEFQQGVTFSRVGGGFVYPNLETILIQFSIFARTHAKLGEVSSAIANIFNEDHNQTSGDISIVYSQKQGNEFDLPSDLDDPNYYQRSVTYLFKIR